MTDDFKSQFRDITTEDISSRISLFFDCQVSESSLIALAFALCVQTVLASLCFISFCIELFVVVVQGSLQNNLQH